MSASFFGMSWRPTYVRTRKGNGQLDTTANLAYESPYSYPLGDVAGRGGFVAGTRYKAFSTPRVILNKAPTIGDVDGYGFGPAGSSSRDTSPLSLDQKGKSGI